MSKYLKFSFIFALVIIISIPFIGSYSVQSIDEFAYLIALGVDVGETNTLKVTFMFTKAVSSSEGASSDPAPNIIDSVEASSINSAISLMNTYASKEINLGHCKVIVFSEELASHGISNEIYTLLNNVQIRPDTNVIVSKCTANSFISNTKVSFENLVGKYYETAAVSSEYTGYTANITLGDFFNRLTCNTCQPTAMLGSISTDDSDAVLNTSTASFSGQLETSGTAGASPLENKGASEIMGVAVFKKDVFAGELSALETMCHLLLRDEIQNCTVTIPNPNNTESNIDLYLYNGSKPKIKVQIINGTPYIEVDLNLEARLLSVSSTSSYDSEERLSEITLSANQYLETIFTNYLYKTSVRLGCDIDGFAKHALHLFLTTDEYESYNWLENYRDATFKVNVDTKVRSSYLVGGGS